MVFENKPMLCADTTLLTRDVNARLQIVEILRGHLNPVSNATLAVDLEDDDVAPLLVSPVSASLFLVEGGDSVTSYELSLSSALLAGVVVGDFGVRRPWKLMRNGLPTLASIVSLVGLVCSGEATLFVPWLHFFVCEVIRFAICQQLLEEWGAF